MRAIYNIARTTFGEAVRRKIVLIILILGLAFIIITPGLGILSPRSERAAVTSLTLGLIQMTSALLAITLTIYLVPNEIDRRTIYTILCKPVRRYQFIWGKYLGAVATIGLMILMMTLVLLAVFAFQFNDRGFNASEAAELAKAPLMFFFQMSLLAAVAMFFSVWTSPIVNFFLTSGTYIAGTVFNGVFETLKESRSTSPMAKGLSELVQNILPNFGKFQVQNAAVNPGQVIQSEAIYFGTAILYAVVYSVVMISLASVLFENREV